ncbi:hypothetical protein FGIG_07766 [Fasciola gigantica]|uniref:Uncharacterized protein n=1 Tax=Fasciola gigantica TaxID=46835 RepID=A0A504Y5B6_FASGI|nr:hypothetical protein FGIG_07766 [Fasciola gigantica]
MPALLALITFDDMHMEYRFFSFVHKINIRNIDVQKSEFIPRECDVLDSDLEMSTITFSIRVPRIIDDCYHLDVDELLVVRNK